MSEQPAMQDDRSRSASALLMAALWPSFIVAGLATGVFFAYNDPAELSGGWFIWFGGDRLSAYSAVFLFFWLLTTVAAFAALYMRLAWLSPRISDIARDEEDELSE